MNNARTDLRPFITTLRFLSFMKDFDRRADGVRTIQFSKSIAPNRKLEVRLCSNGLHRAVHIYDDCVSTEPTRFTTGSLMLVAILHEATRTDNRKYAEAFPASDANLERLLHDAIPFIKRSGTVASAGLVDDIRDAISKRKTPNPRPGS